MLMHAHACFIRVLLSFLLLLNKRNMNNYDHLLVSAIKTDFLVDNGSKFNVTLVGVSYNILMLSKLKVNHFTY
jgi:hypothetical protein